MKLSSTDLAKQNGQSVDEAAAIFVKQHRPTSLLQRFASPEEIANMVVYVKFKTSICHQWRGAPGRGRYRSNHRVRCGMSAYVISEVDVKDAAGFEAYRTIAAKAIAHYGGRYLVRGGAATVAEGGPPPKNIIVVEFPSMRTIARMVRLAGICRGAQAPADRAGPPVDFCRGFAGRLARDADMRSYVPGGV